MFLDTDNVYVVGFGTVDEFLKAACLVHVLKIQVDRFSYWMSLVLSTPQSGTALPVYLRVTRGVMWFELGSGYARALTMVLLYFSSFR